MYASLINLHLVVGFETQKDTLRPTSPRYNPDKREINSLYLLAREILNKKYVCTSQFLFFPGADNFSIK